MLTDARGGQTAGDGLAGQLDAAIDSTRQLERLLESMVTATTVAHTDVNASDLAAALADVQTMLRTIPTGRSVVVDAPSPSPPVPRRGCERERTDRSSETTQPPIMSFT